MLKFYSIMPSYRKDKENTQDIAKENHISAKTILTDHILKGIQRREDGIVRKKGEMKHFKYGMPSS